MDDKETFKAALRAVQLVEADLVDGCPLPGAPPGVQELPVTPTPSSAPSFVRPHEREINDVPTKETSMPSSPNTKPIKVLVSWAHTNEDWSKAEATRWATEVMEFTLALRNNGIDADIDLFYSHDKLADWTRFGQKAVKESQYVLVAMTKAWAERWSGENKPTVGAGVAVEADTLKGLFTTNQDALQDKLKIIVLASKSADDIPHDMARYQRFHVDVHQPETFIDLLRTLTDQPYYVRPPLGNVPVLAPASRMKAASSPVAYGPSRPRSDRPVSPPRPLKDAHTLRNDYDFLSVELKLGVGSRDTSRIISKMAKIRSQLQALEG